MEADHSLGLFSTLRVNEVLQRDAADLFSALQRSVTLSVHFLLLLSSSTVDTRRLIVPLCRPLAALISVWVLWEHDIVERAETAVCEGEGVNSIPTAEMAFKCLSLCTPIVLQTHYLSASLCVSTSIRARASNVFPSHSSNHLRAPTRLTRYLSVLIFFSFIMLPLLSSCQRSLLRCNLAPAAL